MNKDPNVPSLSPMHLALLCIKFSGFFPKAYGSLLDGTTTIHEACRWAGQRTWKNPAASDARQILAGRTDGWMAETIIATAVKICRWRMENGGRAEDIREGGAPEIEILRHFEGTVIIRTPPCQHHIMVQFSDIWSGKTARQLPCSIAKYVRGRYRSLLEPETPA